jgi:AcrR family transcriptional regulator
MTENNAERQTGEKRGRGRPRTARADDRRAIIIDCAYKAFLELGYAGTTTDLVAARAKVSKREIYGLFSSKTVMFGEIILARRHLILDLPRPGDEDIPILDALCRIFRIDIDEDEQKERDALLHLVVRESLHFPELNDYLYDNEIIRSRENLMDWLSAEAAKGRIVVEDAATCAGMLMDIVFGALLPRRRRHGQSDGEFRRRHIRRCFEIFVRGVSPP